MITTTVDRQFQFMMTTQALTSVIQLFHLTAKIVHVVKTVHYISADVHNVIDGYSVQIKNLT